MILYFAPLSCSMVVRIVANELQIPLTYKQVEIFDPKAPKTLTTDNTPYKSVAPLELVPFLDLADGHHLTEVTAIVQYLAELEQQDTPLLPKPGTAERYEVLKWLSCGATELHKRILWPIINRDTPIAVKRHAISLAPQTFDYLANHLTPDREYLSTSHFTLADAYFAWVLAVTPFLLRKVPLPPGLQSYANRVHARPSVKESLSIEMPLLEKAIRSSDR